MDVTVYRCRGGKVERQVISGCHLEVTENWQQDPSFFLAAPGERKCVFVGDRILPGIGPQVDDWSRFVPALVPGLLIPTYAKAYYLDGTHHHTEAGH